MHYLTRRRTSREFWARFWAKLTVVCHTRSYLWLGMGVAQGPSYDAPQLPAVVRQAAQWIPLDRILADAGYDSEANHEVCRRELRIRSTVIALNRRGFRRWPKGRYRRQMFRSFHRRVYGRRAHVESSFSQDKRHFGSALRARQPDPRKRELHLRVLTHNIAILKRSLWGFLQSPLTPMPVGKGFSTRRRRG